MERVNGGYRWELRKGGKKMRCPACGQMRFVPFVSASDGVTLAGEEYGRCDREQNCGYFRYPNGKNAPSATEPRLVVQEEPLRFYPAAVRTDPGTNLFDYVAGMVGVAKAIRVWNNYKIGRDGTRTVFWYIDKDGNVRAGKSIPYGKDGHRIKTDKYPASWLHKCKSWDMYRKGKGLQLCYFGEHLLNVYPDKPVAIVESEKTAAVLSAYSDTFLWLASGGSQMIKQDEKNEVLKDRGVLLVPDNGQYWNWKAIADKNGWEITTKMEKCPCFSGCDILDMIETGTVHVKTIDYEKDN